MVHVPEDEWRLVFVGAGAMAEAIISGVLEGGKRKPENLVVSDIRADRLQFLKERYGVQVSSDNRTAVGGASMVILSVKPAQVRGVLEELRAAIGPEQLVVSIAAGVRTSDIEEALGSEVAVVRVMPNTACLVRESATVLCRGRWASPEDELRVLEIFQEVGKAAVLPEELMDAVTGLSGSGPAYVYLVIEALADGGVGAGLSRQTALGLAAQTVLGAARMVLETGSHPGSLKDSVTSPAGTTASGLRVLEDRGVRGAFISAVLEATKRSRELGAAKAGGSRLGR